MPDWLCLEDECEFEKDPVKVIGLYSLFLLAKSLLHAPLFCLLSIAVAMLKRRKIAALVHVVRYFRGLCTVSKHRPGLPLCPLPKKKKKKATSTRKLQYKQR